MMEEATRRRSKIYTYFYGRSTVFQKFLIIVGVLFILLSAIAKSANINTYYEKLDDLKAAYNTATDDYNEEYNTLRKSVKVTKGEKVTISAGDDKEAEKKAYNKALEKYEDAKKAYEDHRKKDVGGGFVGGLSTLIGVGSVIVALIWVAYKKLTFHSIGEEEYEAEIADRLEAAKAKGLEKLGLVAEQLEEVKPVAINGVANTDDLVIDMAGGLLRKLFGRFLQFILAFDNLILGLITVGIYSAIVGAMAQGTGGAVFFFLVSLAGAGYIGYRLYTKYEVDSFVPDRVFNRLEQFAPVFILRRGSDDRVRVSLPAFNVYMFGKEQLYVYHACVDIVTGETFGEGIHEYFYEDIVAVKSNQAVKKLLVPHGFLKLFRRVVRYQVENIAIATSGCTHQQTYIVDMGKSLLDDKFVDMRNLVKNMKDEKKDEV